MEPSRQEKQVAPRVVAAALVVKVCAHCKRAIGKEYYFQCLKCGRCYCYIHMRRHDQAHARTPVAPRISVVAARPQRPRR